MLGFYLLAKSDLTNAEVLLRESVDINRKSGPDNKPGIANGECHSCCLVCVLLRVIDLCELCKTVRLEHSW